LNFQSGLKQHWSGINAGPVLFEPLPDKVQEYRSNAGLVILP
jgi:hypothetical protein